MSLKLYNTLSREIENFYTLNGDKNVKMYSCGPTVYSNPHIGNMRAYVFTDLLKRVLISNGYSVFNAINITDVGHLTSDADEGEDKLEREAKKTGRNAYEIAEFYSNVFFKDIDKLNLLPANIYPKATEHILEQIEMISVLEQKGFTYTIDDGVYFNTAKFKTYADFAKINIEGLDSGNRVEVNKQKINKTDFALWKFSEKKESRQMEWDSPWGVGFPGWHAECSAMILKHLGEQIDIHTGGVDHISVHHTNEIAQTESTTGKKFSNFWLHVNFLQLKDLKSEDGELMKMSKSMGNVLTISGLENEGYDPMVVKYFYLMSHYRSELQFNFDILSSVKSSFVRLQERIRLVKESAVKEQSSDVFNQMVTELNNDLNTPKVIAMLHESLASNLNFDQKLKIINFIENAMGLSFDIKVEMIPEEVMKIAEDRLIAKKNKDFGKSDSLRKLIEDKGYVVKDNGISFELIKK